MFEVWEKELQRGGESGLFDSRELTVDQVECVASTAHTLWLPARSARRVHRWDDSELKFCPDRPGLAGIQKLSETSQLGKEDKR